VRVNIQEKNWGQSKHTVLYVYSDPNLNPNLI
ncbi:MAG: hypothetical protein ACI9JU_003108, partial [Pseudohongiellaceae bacterium]